MPQIAMSPRELIALESLRTCISDSIYQRAIAGKDMGWIAAEWNTNQKVLCKYLDERYGGGWREVREFAMRRDLTIATILEELKAGESCSSIAKKAGVNTKLVYYRLKRYRELKRHQLQQREVQTR